MKRVFSVLLSLVMAAGLAGCSGGDDVNVVGNWTKTNTWNGRQPDTWDAVLYKDGTYISLNSQMRKVTGVWSLKDKEITISFGSPTPCEFHVGKVGGDSDRMSGNLTGCNGATGTWTATLASRSTPARSMTQLPGGE